MGNTEKSINKSSTVALAIILAINAVWLVCYLLTYSSRLSFQFFVCLLELAIAVIYATYDYKKPHGNLMKYLLLVFVVTIAILLLIYGKYQPTYINTMYLIDIITGTYMAGRLDRYKQNIVICALITISNAVIAYYLIDMIGSFTTLTFVNTVACLGTVTVWLAIAGGYVIRYKLHKEAGLENK